MILISLSSLSSTASGTLASGLIKNFFHNTRNTPVWKEMLTSSNNEVKQKGYISLNVTISMPSALVVLLILCITLLKHAASNVQSAEAQSIDYVRKHFTVFVEGTMPMKPLLI